MVHSVDRFQVVRSQREPMPEIVLAATNGTFHATIDAAQLIAQFDAGPDATLLVLDEDCPYEEQLHLVLVRAGKASDHIVIGAPYATGIFEILGGTTDSLRFRFANDGVWTASVRDAGALLPPRLPRGARRKGGWLGPHHLSLSFEKDQG